MLRRVLQRLKPAWIRRFSGPLLETYQNFAPAEILNLSEGAQLCVIAPHPDDESIGCGGLIAQWTASGRQAEVILLTEGELGSRDARDQSLSETKRQHAMKTIAKTRRKEAAVAAETLGAELIWFSGPDGALARDVSRLAGELSDHWRVNRPDLIAAPFPADKHPDHAAAARIVAKAAAANSLLSTRILGYEVWSAAPVTAVLDITDVADIKRAAIARHESQTATTDYVEGSMALNRYRAVTSGTKARYCEGYYATDCRGYARLTDSLQL